MARVSPPGTHLAVSRPRQRRSSTSAFLLFCTLLPATLTSPACSDPPAAPPSGSPNILFILADDLGYGDLGAYGNGKIATPHLDRLALEGTRFTRFYANGPICTPTRVALLTGRYPQRFGLYGGLKLDSPWGLPPDTTTLPELLRQAGYETVHVGKWHVGHAEEGFRPLASGLDDFFGFLHAHHLPKTYHDPRLRRGEEPDRVRAGHLTDLLAEEAESFLRRSAGSGKPFFLNLWTFSPHKPLQPPKRWAERYDDTVEGRYAALVSALDENVGRLLTVLDETGLARDTLVVFTSDNGGSRDVHGGRNGPLRGGKNQLTEGGIRVPLIVRWPGRVPAGTVRDDLTASFDWFPTLLELAGVETDAIDVDGRSLVRVLEGSAPAFDGPIFWQDVHRDQHRFAVRYRHWKLLSEKCRTSLFDLRRDPGEDTDLSAHEPEIVAEMTAAHRRWRLDTAPGQSAADRTLRETPSSPAAQKRPNLILLLTDDQRWDALGAAGNSVIQTPNLDRLAAEGMIFRQAFVTTSICSVSRASILSGQYAHRHGIRDFDRPFSRDALDRTYPALLREAGYYTGFIGKWGVGARRSPNLDAASTIFDYWAGASHQSNYWHEKTCRYVTANGLAAPRDSICNCPADSRGRSGPDIRKGRQNLRQPIHLTTRIIPDKVKRFLDARDPNRPFCLSISFKAPHGPVEDWAPPFGGLYENAEMPVPATATVEAAARMPGFLRESPASDRGRALIERRGKDSALQHHLRNYYRMISGVDSAIGQIREMLAARHLAEDTVILFTSDNGHLMGAHGLRGKWLMYEDSIRVPTLVYDPRLPAAKRGHASDEMVLNIDIAPTLLELAGLSVPERMQGKSMVPLLIHPNLEFRERWFYEHHFNPRGANHIERSEGVRTRRLKYIRYIDQDPQYEELFDLDRDRDEIHNLVEFSDYREALDRLRRDYLELRPQSVTTDADPR